jgi:hypothetical protein
MTSLGDLLRAEADVKPDQPAAARVTAWEHEPVSLSVFVLDEGYLANPRLSEIQYDAVRHIERVYYQDAYPLLAEMSSDPETRAYWAEPVRMVNFAELEWGKGGGKDMVCRVASLRVAYLLLCLKSPLEYYGFPRHDSIHLLNVAESSHQAGAAFFTPLRKAVIDSTGWFARHGYAHPLKNQIEYAKNVIAISGHSDAETQEGLNILLGVADEIDGFKTLAELERYMGASARESSRAAEVLLSMMETSGSTRFPETFKNVRLSWPRYMGSTIQQLVAQGNDDLTLRGEDSRHYVSGPHCTWDVNPLRKRSDFQRLFDRDPVLAAARLECRPARATNPYFANTAVIDAAMSDNPVPPITVSYELKDGSWQPHYEFSPDFVPVKGAAYAMHADMALKNDRAGICISHVARWDQVEVAGHDDEGGDVPVWESRPFVKVDALFGFEADSSVRPPREIQLRWARLLFLELRRRGWNMRRFTADGWQSVDMFQILETQYGIETDLVSTDRDEGIWRGLKDLLNERRIEIPHSELCKMELFGLSKLPNGKVDHPNGGSKDLADALACSASGALELGSSEEVDAQGRPVEAHLASSDWQQATPEGDLPIGFVPPYAMRYDEVLRNHVSLDGMGMPLGPSWYDEAEPAHQD